LLVDGGLKPNYQYEVTSADNFPTPEQLRTATVDSAPDPIYYDLPSSLPSEIRNLAQDVTALATTPYDKAIALKNWFRANFEYSLTAKGGHSNDAMLNFLSIKKGYCEQFSGTFAAMARSIGLPTRVIVGFTQGQLRSDGLYHVAGRDAHAWDEVWFDGFGWVLFDPTPGRGAQGASATGVDAGQQQAP
jgi:transglutaminase-like putative cysteine protease